MRTLLARPVMSLANRLPHSVAPFIRDGGLDRRHWDHWHFVLQRLAFRISGHYHCCWGRVPDFDADIW